MFPKKPLNIQIIPLINPQHTPKPSHPACTYNHPIAQPKAKHFQWQRRSSNAPHTSQDCLAKLPDKPSPTPNKSTSF